MTKRIKIPQDELSIVNAEGAEVGKRNIFFHFLNLVVDSTPQRTDTETFIAHSIGEKLPKNGNAPKTLDLEDAEIEFVNGGIKKLREQDKVVGKGWYFLLTALREAEPVQAKPLNKK